MILIYMLLSFLLVIGVSALFWKLAAKILPLPIAIGAWCFHDRATGRDGKPVDWLGAFKLSGVAIGLNALAALLLIAVAVTVDS